MIDFKDWIEKIHKIKRDRLISTRELYEELGISYASWVRIRDCDPTKLHLRFATIRKIRDFIEKHTPKV